MQSPPARASQTHLATPARRSPRPRHLTTHNRALNTGIPLVPAQMGARSRVRTNIQAPNTVGANRRRAVKDMNAQNIRENRVQNTGEDRVQNTGEDMVQNTGEKRVQVT